MDLYGRIYYLRYRAKEVVMANNSYPFSETGLAIGIWSALGVVVLVYLVVRHPARLPEMKRVFADEEPTADQPVASGGAA
jgi:hypothetical protein